MGATTTRRARIVAGGLIACGAGLILSASSAFATQVDQDWDAVVTTSLYSPGDPTTTVPEDTTPEDTTPDETTATTVDDYAPGDPVTSETTDPAVEVADTVAAAPTTAAAAGELPRTGGASLPLGLLGAGSIAGGSALLAALRPRRRA